MRICFTGGIIFAISAMLDDDTIAQASTRLWHSWDYKVCFVGALFTRVEYLAFEYLIIDLNYVNALLISLWLNYNFSCAKQDMCF